MAEVRRHPIDLPVAVEAQAITFCLVIVSGGSEAAMADCSLQAALSKRAFHA